MLITLRAAETRASLKSATCLVKGDRLFFYRKTDGVEIGSSLVDQGAVSEVSVNWILEEQPARPRD